MGLIFSPTTGRAAALGHRTLVGRGPECGLVLQDRRASTHHASLTWREGAWQLRDLGSRNGTEVDGEAVATGVSRTLRAGEELSFGGGSPWILLDAGPPGPVGLVVEGGQAVGARGGMLVLPEDADPQLVVYGDGEDGWLLEEAGEVGPCPVDLERELAGRSWRVLLPVVPRRGEVPSTWGRAGSKEVEAIGLRFTVSRDEEHVDTELDLGGERTCLRPRVHHFVLLELARRRLADRAAGVGAAEEGWAYVEDLCQGLDLRTPVLNLQLLRARQELAELGVEGVGRLFERRRLSGQLRLGPADVTVRSS